MNALLQSMNDLAPTLLALLAKGAAICGAALTMTLLLRRAEAAKRHLVWACTAAALIALPALSFALPAWRVLPIGQASAATARTPLAAELPTPAQTAPRPIARTPAGTAVDTSTLTPRRSKQTDLAESPLTSTAPAALPGRAAPSLRLSPDAPSSLTLAWPVALVLIWAVGSLFLFLRLGGQLFALWRCTASASPDLARTVRSLFDELPALRRTRLVALPAGAMPMTWGAFRQTVALPADAIAWPADQLKAVLRHELAHIVRRDWAWLVVARIARALHWPNPLAWLVAARLGHEQERACDDRVLTSGTAASDYASHLLAIVQSTCPTRHVGIAMARPSQVESRLVAILDASRRRTALSRRWLSFALLVLCLIVVPMAALRAAAPDSPPTSRPAIPSTRPTTMPSLVDTQYRELPFPPIVDIPQDLPTLGDLPDNRIALRVLDGDGRPVRIDRIIEAYFVRADRSQWYNGDSYEIFSRFADGWVAIDAGLYPTFINEKTPAVVFWSDGVPIDARGEFVGDGRIECKPTETPAGIGVDLRAGPADVAIDEVAGRVVGPDGKPVAGAVVSLPQSDRRPNLPKSFREPIVTGADGVFRFPDFARQWYVTCTVEAPGYATRYLTTLPVGRPFTVRLDDRTRLAGSLLNPDGSDASNATITLISSRATWRQKIVAVLDDMTQTINVDQAGRYDALIEPGEYDVRIRSASGVARHMKFVVRAGESQSLPRELTAGITARIRVLNSITQEPVEGFRLYVAENDLNNVKPRPQTDVTTDAEGRAEWPQLTEGTELAYADLTTKYARWSCDEAVHYDYDDGTNWLQFKFRPDMPELVILAEPAMQVSGQLIDPDGNPVAGALVNVSGLQTGDMRHSTRTDATGHYTMYLPDKSSRRSEDRRIAASQPWGLPVRIVARDPKQAFGNAISASFDIRAGESRELNLTLARGTTVSGRVVGKDGKPVAQIEVEAIIEDDSDTYYLTPRTLTDADGRFTFAALRPGRYFVVPDLVFGISRSSDPRFGQRREPVVVREGRPVSDLVLTHDGAPPPPVPEKYDDWMK